MLKQKHIYPIILVVLILTLTAATAFAEGGDGTGGGNGKNRNIPLTLKSTSIADGASNVSRNETIQLNFNKNICNITVLANNKKCFHLTDSEGNTAAIRLIFPDNQVQKEYRREVFIQPVKPLKKNTEYKVAVDSTLQAKNGTVIDNAYNITFTTGSKKTSQENKILKKLGQNIITYETAYGETADSVPVDKSGLDQVSQDQPRDTAGMARIAAVIFALVLVVFTVVIFLFKRKRK